MAHPSQVVAFGSRKQSLVVNYSAADRTPPTMTMKIMHYEVDPTDGVMQNSDVNGSSVPTDFNR